LAVSDLSILHAFRSVAACGASVLFMHFGMSTVLAATISDEKPDKTSQAEIKPLKWGKGWQHATLSALIIDKGPAQKPELERVQSKNADVLIPPASLAKLMSAYVVFDAIRNGEIGLDTEIRKPREANNLIFSGFARLPKGVGSFTVREALTGMLLQSNNILTYSLAVAVAGSEAAFVKRMNDKAQELELHHTIFLNSTGLPVMPHYPSNKDRLDSVSTVSEISQLALRLYHDFQEEEFQEIMRSKKATLDDRPLRIGLSSTTKIGLDGYVLGKSGYLGGCSNGVAMIDTDNDQKPDAVIGVICASNRGQRDKIFRRLNKKVQSEEVQQVAELNRRDYQYSRQSPSLVQ